MRGGIGLRLMDRETRTQAGVGKGDSDTGWDLWVIISIRHRDITGHRDWTMGAEYQEAGYWTRGTRHGLQALGFELGT